MTNEQIASSVQEVAGAILREVPIEKLAPQEREAVAAGVALITNLLQNINTIAAAAKA